MHIMDTAQLKNDCYRSYVLKEALQDPYVKKKKARLETRCTVQKRFYVCICVHTLVCTYTHVNMHIEYA